MAKTTTEKRAIFLEERIPVAIFALAKQLEREAKTHGAEEDWKGVWSKITSEVTGRRVTYDRQAVFQHDDLIWRGTGQIPPRFVEWLRGVTADGKRVEKVAWADLAANPERAPKLWNCQFDDRTYGWNGERAVPEWAWEAYSKGDVEALKAMVIPGAPVNVKELLAKHLPQKKKFWAPPIEKQLEMAERQLRRVAAEAAKPKRGPGRPRKVEAAPPLKAKRRT
jgi:hypothetical protein